MDTKSNEDTKAALLQFKKDVTKSVLSMVREVTDKDTQSVLFKSLTKMTEDGGQQFDDGVKKDIADSVANMARQKLGLVPYASSKRRRRRRDVGDGGADENLMTLEEVTE